MEECFKGDARLSLSEGGGIKSFCCFLLALGEKRKSSQKPAVVSLH